MNEQDFYVGYESAAPAGVARFVRRLIGLALPLTPVLSGLVVLLHQPFDSGTFEYGVIRELEGVLREKPVPALLLQRPGRLAANGSAATGLLLVAPGKHGAGALVSGLGGQWVGLRGSLIYRAGTTMLEVEREEIGARARATPTAVESVPVADLGHHVLRGEIVDSKCYLGVMKPGRGKTHRSCAVRCISGGIPPALIVADDDGVQTLLLLVGEQGQSLHAEILDYVSEPIEITGWVRRHGDRLILYSDPGSIVRLSN